MVARRRGARTPQADLFAEDPTSWVQHRLDSQALPLSERLPLNRASRRLRGEVWADLVGSERPLLVAGFSVPG